MQIKRTYPSGSSESKKEMVFADIDFTDSKFDALLKGDELIFVIGSSNFKNKYSTTEVLINGSNDNKWDITNLTKMSELNIENESYLYLDRNNGKINIRSEFTRNNKTSITIGSGVCEKINTKLIGFVAPHFITEDNVAYNVNNEFNSVTVEAMFSDKQLFQGKGAGAFPTASAVLSDISALQFDYSYEYKKSLTTENIEFSNDIVLKIYAGASNLNDLDIFNWIEKEETFQGKDYAYITGFIKLNKI